ncbi:MAG: hypothetical protein KIG63_02605 [Methanobrevibacter sp.]|nr:hypothetical protein [Methanobrevibacter sp.]
MILQGGSTNMELKLKQFKDTLIKAINEAELPLSLVSFVMKELLQEVEELRSRQLQQELAEAAEAEAQEKIEIVE